MFFRFEQMIAAALERVEGALPHPGTLARLPDCAPAVGAAFERALVGLVARQFEGEARLPGDVAGAA